jgi:hypothetical protein
VFKRKRLEPHRLRVEALTSSHGDISLTGKDLETTFADDRRRGLKRCPGAAPDARCDYVRNGSTVTD